MDHTEKNFQSSVQYKKTKFRN